MPCCAMLHRGQTLHKPHSPAQRGRTSTAKRSGAISTSEGAELFKLKDSAVTSTGEDKLAVNKLRLEEGRMELWASSRAEGIENGSPVLFPAFPRRWQDAQPQKSLAHRPAIAWHVLFTTHPAVVGPGAPCWTPHPCLPAPPESVSPALFHTCGLFKTCVAFLYKCQHRPS